MINILDIVQSNYKPGDKLYSAVCGECEFYKITKHREIVLKFKYQGRDESTCYVYDEYGRLNCMGEPVLFPSKENRNWLSLIPKFDITSLKPFDKVLVRDFSYSHWDINLFSGLNLEQKECKFGVLNKMCNQCVPYNEETKHLLGTTENAPEKYIHW